MWISFPSLVSSHTNTHRHTTHGVALAKLHLVQIYVFTSNLSCSTVCLYCTSLLRFIISRQQHRHKDHHLHGQALSHSSFTNNFIIIRLSACHEFGGAVVLFSENSLQWSTKNEMDSCCDNARWIEVKRSPINRKSHQQQRGNEEKNVNFDVRLTVCWFTGLLVIVANFYEFLGVCNFFPVFVFLIKSCISAVCDCLTETITNEIIHKSTRTKCTKRKRM